jgi:hypothetical protein
VTEGAQLLARAVVLALVVASRFGLLLGLALWVGLGIALLLLLPVVQRQLPAAQADDVVGAAVRKVETVLYIAAALVMIALGARVLLDRAAPPTTLVLPVMGMIISRLLSALAVSPSVRALRQRLRDANAPATDAERSAFGRLEGARRLLLSLEVCLALYALYAIA